LQNDYHAFEDLNAEILAISVESLDMARRVSELLELQYPVLSDTDHTVVDLYGVYNLLGDGVATPSVFVIDLQGIIRWEYVGQSPTDRPDSETILEQLRALQASWLLRGPATS
jgi:peroxiredoxin